VNNPDYSHNDLPVLCSEKVDMAIFQPNIDAEAAVFLLDDDLSPITHNITMTPVPPVPGSSLIYDYEADTIIRIGAPEIETEDSLPRNKLIVFTVYWDQAEPYEVKTDVDLTSTGIGYDWHAYWPQGIQRIGDFYLVAHMARPVDGGYNQDDGNLFLQLFDQNFNVIETHQLTDDAGPFANQRPSLTLQDDILLVTYDKRIQTNQNSEGELANHVMSITLDMDALNAGSPNLAPTAYAGADFNGAIDALAQLDGSGSSDPDNDELDFSWSFSFVPDESGLTDEDIVNRLTDEASFVPDALGDYKLLLTVSDGEAEDTDEVVVTVVENLSPVADAGGNQSVGLTESVLLDGSASEDPDGDELSYLWYFESLPESSALADTDISAASSAIAAFAPDVEGTYEVTLMVTDGTFEATDTVEITVGSGGCACASSPTPLAAASWASVLMGLLVLRRRERE
jgi:MYXO-CTERM domain-containing protein